jgi:Rrf2 family iron-sulfur cluster assembly transcriptional regulator
MITREADYAIRVMVLLAQREKTEGGGASSLEIADEMDIPYRFLRKLVTRMVSGRLLCSRRGKGGGLTLAREAEQITLFDVLQVMSPTGTRLSQCLAEGETCRRACTCRMHRAIGGIQAVVDRQLRDVTLASLVD